MKPFFVAANVLMSGCVLALFLSLTSAAKSDSQATTIAEAGVVVMAFISIGTAAGFLIYSFVLAKTLTKVSASNEALAARMLQVAAVVASSFIVRIDVVLDSDRFL